MNAALDRVAAQCALSEPARTRLRLAFGYACVRRVEHLLEQPEVSACLHGLGDYLAGTIGREDLDRLSVEASRLANQHQGSKSIDGCGHAAVSATYAVAKAVAGKALEAASYAAYATVYAQGGYAAVADRESFMPEWQWQVETLSALAVTADPAAPRSCPGCPASNLPAARR